MTNIYEQHDAAFNMLSAYVVLNSRGDKVATIAFKHPRDGAGRLYAYVHWIGLEMTRGFATGGGYDKCSAACSSAAQKLKPLLAEHAVDSPARAFLAALAHDDGNTWHNHLLAARFNVLQAV